MQKADHSGHRNRLREKYLNGGIEILAPHEVIEMLLFNAVPYRNTNDIAKRLLDAFGSLSAVFDASLEMLMNAGLTRNQAAYIKLIPDVTRLYLLDRNDNPSKIIDYDMVGDYFIKKFIGVSHEERVLLLLMDEKCKELFCGFVADGGFDTAAFSNRKVMRMCVSYGAHSVIMAHNHPSGFGLPSAADYRSTVKLRELLASIDVILIDHFIIADDEAVSMVQTGLLEEADTAVYVDM